MRDYITKIYHPNHLYIEIKNYTPKLVDLEVVSDYHIARSIVFYTLIKNYPLINFTLYTNTIHRLDIINSDSGIGYSFAVSKNDPNFMLKIDDTYRRKKLFELHDVLGNLIAANNLKLEMNYYSGSGICIFCIWEK